MFRHNRISNVVIGKSNVADMKKETNNEKKEEESAKEKIDVTPPNDITETLKELLEKNLKWSQIIYEQNRRINRKLLWSAIAGWFRTLIIVVPLILAVVYLSPIIKRAISQYRELFDAAGSVNGALKEKTWDIDSIIKMLPLDAAQEQRLRSMFK